MSSISNNKRRNNTNNNNNNNNNNNINHNHNHNHNYDHLSIQVPNHHQINYNYHQVYEQQFHPQYMNYHQQNNLNSNMINNNNPNSGSNNPNLISPNQNSSSTSSLRLYTNQPLTLSSPMQPNNQTIYYHPSHHHVQMVPPSPMTPFDVQYGKSMLPKNLLISSPFIQSNNSHQEFFPQIDTSNYASSSNSSLNTDKSNKSRKRSSISKNLNSKLNRIESNNHNHNYNHNHNQDHHHHHHHNHHRNGHSNKKSSNNINSTINNNSTDDDEDLVNRERSISSDSRSEGEEANENQLVEPEQQHEEEEDNEEEEEEEEEEEDVAVDGLEVEDTSLLLSPDNSYDDLELSPSPTLQNHSTKTTPLIEQLKSNEPSTDSISTRTLQFLNLRNDIKLNSFLDSIGNFGPIENCFSESLSNNELTTVEEEEEEEQEKEEEEEGEDIDDNKQEDNQIDQDNNNNVEEDNNNGKIIYPSKSITVSFINSTIADKCYKDLSKNLSTLSNNLKSPNLLIKPKNSAKLLPIIKNAIENEGASRVAFIKYESFLSKHNKHNISINKMQRILITEFEKFGLIESIKLLPKYNSAFIYFNSIASSMKAVEQLPISDSILSNCFIFYGKDRNIFSSSINNNSNNNHNHHHRHHHHQIGSDYDVNEIELQNSRFSSISNSNQIDIYSTPSTSFSSPKISNSFINLNQTPINSGSYSNLRNLSNFYSNSPSSSLPDLSYSNNNNTATTTNNSSSLNENQLIEMEQNDYYDSYNDYGYHQPIYQLQQQNIPPPSPHSHYHFQPNLPIQTLQHNHHLNNNENNNQNINLHNNNNNNNNNNRNGKEQYLNQYSNYYSPNHPEIPIFNNVNNRTVYLGNLLVSTTIEDICNTIRGGKIDSINLLVDKHICFITFISSQDATDFYVRSNSSSSNPLVINGRHIKVLWGKKSPKLSDEIAKEVYENNASRNVYIGIVEEDKNANSQNDESEDEDEDDENDEKDNNNNNDNNDNNNVAPNEKETPSSSSPSNNNGDDENSGSENKLVMPDIDTLKRDFSAFGEIEQVNYFKDGQCAFVNFINVRSAIAVVNEANGEKASEFHKSLGDKYIGFKINYGKDRCGNPPKSRKSRKQKNQKRREKLRLKKMNEMNGNSSSSNNNNINSNEKNNNINDESVEKDPGLVKAFESIGITSKRFSTNLSNNSENGEVESNVTGDDNQNEHDEQLNSDNVEIVNANGNSNDITNVDDDNENDNKDNIPSENEDAGSSEDEDDEDEDDEDDIEIITLEQNGNADDRSFIDNGSRDDITSQSTIASSTILPTTTKESNGNVDSFGKVKLNPEQQRKNSKGNNNNNTNNNNNKPAPINTSNIGYNNSRRGSVKTFSRSSSTTSLGYHRPPLTPQHSMFSQQVMVYPGTQQYPQYYQATPPPPQPQPIQLQSSQPMLSHSYSSEYLPQYPLPHQNSYGMNNQRSSRSHSGSHQHRKGSVASSGPYMYNHVSMLTPESRSGSQSPTVSDEGIYNSKSNRQNSSSSSSVVVDDDEISDETESNGNGHANGNVNGNHEENDEPIEMQLSSGKKTKVNEFNVSYINRNYYTDSYKQPARRQSKGNLKHQYSQQPSQQMTPQQFFNSPGIVYYQAPPLPEFQGIYGAPPPPLPQQQQSQIPPQHYINESQSQQQQQQPVFYHDTIYEQQVFQNGTYEDDQVGYFNAIPPPSIGRRSSKSSLSNSSLNGTPNNYKSKQRIIANGNGRR